MRTLLFLFCVTFIGSLYSADILLQTVTTHPGKTVLEFLIGEERIKKIPQWDGLAEMVPLSMTEAMVAARKTAEKEHTTHVGLLKNASFRTRVLPDGSLMWAYSITFKDKRDEEASKYLYYLVLLDGSVISPITKK